MELRFCVKYWYGVYMKRVIFENVSITFLIIALIDLMLFLGPVYPEKVSFFSKSILIFYGSLFIAISGIRYMYKKDFITFCLRKIFWIPLVYLMVYVYLYGFVCGGQNSYPVGAYLVMSIVFITGTFSLLTFAQKQKGIRLFLFFLYGVSSFLFILCAFISLAYYLIYGKEFDVYILLSILQTNVKEAMEYIQTVASPMVIGMIGIVLLGIFIGCFYVAHQLIYQSNKEYYTERELPSKQRWIKIMLHVIFFVGFYVQVCEVFPVDLIIDLRKNSEMAEAFQGTYQSKEVARKKISLLPDVSIDKGTHIIVIGESANRDFMSLYTMNREENTTPWELSLLENPNVVRVKKAYSNFSNTVMALTYALTAKNQYNDMPLREAVNVVDAAHVSGYHTVWISTQTKGDIWGAANSAIAEHADEVYWETGYDEEAVKRLKQISPRKRQIIFIHLYGSHARYKDRIPPGFFIGSYFPGYVEYIDYKSTLLYTDQLLKDIFQYASENLQLQTMIYFSDHGEDMKYRHNPSMFSYDMVRIPFWIYISPAYQKNHPDIMAHFRQNANKVFTNDLVFDTVSGLWGMKTNYYEPIYDFSSPSYALTDDGLTMHGKLRVKSDLNDGTRE